MGDQKKRKKKKKEVKCQIVILLTLFSRLFCGFYLKAKKKKKEKHSFYNVGICALHLFSDNDKQTGKLFSSTCGLACLFPTLNVTVPITVPSI